MDSALVVGQYFSASQLRTLNELEDFWNFYALVDDKVIGFQFSLARRILSLAMEQEDFFGARRRLDRIKVHGQLNTAMIRHLDLWVDLDSPGAMGDHLFVNELRFRGTLKKELLRLDDDDWEPILNQVCVWSFGNESGMRVLVSGVGD